MNHALEQSRDPHILVGDARAYAIRDGVEHMNMPQPRRSQSFYTVAVQTRNGLQLRAESVAVRPDRVATGRKILRNGRARYTLYSSPTKLRTTSSRVRSQ